MTGKAETAKAWSTLRPLNIKQTDDRILSALAGAIERSGLRRGDRLPAEREIGDQLGLSRNTVREALKRWEAMGLVEMRRGSGTYLTADISARSVHIGLTVAAPEDAASLLHVLEVRRGLESEAAALAALRATPEEIAAIAAQYTLVEKVHLRHGAAPREDFRFHEMILDAARSPLLRQIVAAMNEAYTRLWSNPLDLPDFADRSLPFHRTLAEAIAARDPDAARREAIALIDCVADEIRAALAAGATPPQDPPVLPGTQTS